MKRTRIIFVTRPGTGMVPSLRAAFGDRLALRAKPHRKWGWWTSPNSRSAARFDSEYEARCWLHRTFKHAMDREGLDTIEA